METSESEQETLYRIKMILFCDLLNRTFFFSYFHVNAISTQCRFKILYCHSKLLKSFYSELRLKLTRKTNNYFGENVFILSSPVQIRNPS